jgi:hypothetical protein
LVRINPRRPLLLLLYSPIALDTGVRARSREKDEEVGFDGFQTRCGGPRSGLPELQEAVFAVGADQVLVGVVGDADHIFLMNLEGGRTSQYRMKKYNP